MAKKYLVTGGAGFIGSNFIKFLVEKYGDQAQIINLDKLTYAGNIKNLAGLEHTPNYSFVKGDIASRKDVENVFENHCQIDYIVNFAAESHVDRSIADSAPFVETNIAGTQVLLDAGRKYGVKKFLQVSTDEVYGSLGASGYFTEETPLSPNSPYSASKASADLMALAYYRTHGFPAVVTRCSNNYGPFQFPEKLIPLMIANIVNGRPLPVYGEGKNVRDWLYVGDHCSALDAVLEKASPGDVYNIGGNNEKMNIEIVDALIGLLSQNGYPGGGALVKYVKDRPGHDMRYAVDSSKIRKNLGWEPAIDFETGLSETVRWYLENRRWWEEIISGEYVEYYEKMYGGRF